MNWIKCSDILYTGKGTILLATGRGNPHPWTWVGPLSPADVLAMDAKYWMEIPQIPSDASQGEESDRG